MLEVVGWVGSVCLAVCGIPQALTALRQKNSNGISTAFVALWAIGELLTLAYVLPTWQWPLIFNYGANIAALSIIIFYKMFPQEDK